MSSSRLLDELIAALQVMPGIGPVSAARIAYFLLDRRREDGIKLARTLEHSLESIALCPRCRDYSDQKNEPCALCSNVRRADSGLLCVVETPADAQAIEKTGSYEGLYFVLHGRLSPLDGIGPAELGLKELEARLSEGGVKELILAVSQTVEGDATAQFIAGMARRFQLKVSRIASGVPMGGDLVSVDSHTLETSFFYRRPFD